MNLKKHSTAPPDLMDFLDSQFQVDEGVLYMREQLRTQHLSNSDLNSFFKALYPWIDRDPQDAELEEAPYCLAIRDSMAFLYSQLMAGKAADSTI
ncbi:hypothetical protein BD779DRAFT_1675131 [Infundibulicybe gibba]|nr:hypothetical protein BD779DRAFT_1675131 [Infundibulicybe gibba]